jgi:hypothetical protein
MHENIGKAAVILHVVHEFPNDGRAQAETYQTNKDMFNTIWGPR